MIRFVKLRLHFKDLSTSKNSHERTDTFYELASRRMENTLPQPTYYGLAGTDKLLALTCEPEGPYHETGVLSQRCEEVLEERQWEFPPLFQNKAFLPCFSLCLLVPLLPRHLPVSFTSSSSNQESSFYPILPPISFPTSALPILTPPLVSPH